jgi:hypothetical protein
MQTGDTVIFTFGKRLGQIWEVACDDNMGCLELVPVGSNPNMPRPTLLVNKKFVQLNNEVESRY